MSSWIDPAALLWLLLLSGGLGLLAKRRWKCGMLPLALCAFWWLAEATFRRVGLEVVPVACEFTGTAAVERGSRWVPQAQSLVLIQLWMHEVIGMWYYRARGWV